MFHTITSPIKIFIIFYEQDKTSAHNSLVSFKILCLWQLDLPLPFCNEVNKVATSDSATLLWTTESKIAAQRLFYTIFQLKTLS